MKKIGPVVSLVAAVLAAGCVSAGPTISTTEGLGYARPSAGVMARTSARLGRIEASALTVEKRDGGNGWAISGNAMVRPVKLDGLSLLVGADGTFQRVERYESKRLAPRADIAFDLGQQQIGAYWIGKGQKVEQALGMRLLVRGQRFNYLTDFSDVTHTEGRGWRVKLAALWRF